MHVLSISTNTINEFIITFHSRQHKVPFQHQDTLNKVPIPEIEKMCMYYLYRILLFYS
jgi:hypothetical protein